MSVSESGRVQPALLSIGMLIADVHVHKHIKVT